MDIHPYKFSISFYFVAQVLLIMSIWVAHSLKKKWFQGRNHRLEKWKGNKTKTVKCLVLTGYYHY